MVLKEILVWNNLNAICYTMVLKEVAMNKIIDNFGNNGWIWLKFWHNMGAYESDPWYELQLPVSLIVGVNMNCVWF